MVAIDPFVDHCPGLEMRSLDDGLDDFDIVVLLVSHRQFKRMPRQWMREKAVIDVCGMFAQVSID